MVVSLAACGGKKRGYDALENLPVHHFPKTREADYPISQAQCDYLGIDCASIKTL